MLATTRKSSSSTSCSTWLLPLLLTLLSPLVVKAQVACENHNHAYCEKLLYKGSQCRDGFCSNPFEKGCLHTLFNNEDLDETFFQDHPLAQRLRSETLGLRACNSDDVLPDARDAGICTDYEGTSAASHQQIGNMYSEYKEVRIMSQNWESAFFGMFGTCVLLEYQLIL